MRTVITLLLLMFINVTAIAQNATLKVGHLINPVTGTISENKVIKIENGKIKAISNYEDLNESMDFIDLSDAWVTPGLIDCHVHLTINLEYGKFDIYRKYLEDSNAYRALFGAENAKQLLYGGFTTIKEIGSDGDYITADIIKAIDNKLVEGPTIIYAGKIIAPYGGQLKNINSTHEGFWNYEFIDADSKDEIRKAIRKNIYNGASCIKLVSGDQNYFYSKEEIRFAVDEAKKSGLKVTVHALNDDAAKEAILGGVAAIEHGIFLSDETLQLMKENDVFLVGTDLSLENWLAYGIPKEEAHYMYQKTLDRLKRAYSIGVKMAFGTDVIIDLKNKNRLESNYEILKTWKEAKVPALKILQSMTIDAAELLGVENTVGKIEIGYDADIVAFKSNPLEDIENISLVKLVIKQGVVQH
ncbi:amidohydrolase family protein [Xanthomarina gelatinilytica]|uniref:amidohydrolase family protein n=1 Tax=Xanthomarina gelatinilytica TaxID=1137281 RepID=UPI003AA95981